MVLNSAVLLPLAVAVVIGGWMIWPSVKDFLVVDAPANHPDTLSSMDCRDRGLHPIDGFLEHEYQQHEKRMNARATELGYRRAS